MMQGLPDKYSDVKSMDSSDSHRTMAAKYHSVPNGHSISCSSNSIPTKHPGREPDVDALLANAGYTVKASQLAHVAQRLEQLESVLGAAQEAGISHLSSDAVHYNPSDLAGWVECMIGELAPNIADAPQRKGAPDSPFMHVDSSTLDPSLEVATFLADGNSHPRPGSIPRHCVRDIREMTLLEELGHFQYSGGVDDQHLSIHMRDFYSSLSEEEARAVEHVMDISTGADLSRAASSQHRVFPEHGEGQYARQHGMKNEVRPAPLSDGLPPFLDHLRPQPTDDGSRFVTGSQGQPPHVPNGLYAQQPALYADVEEGAQESGIMLVHLLLGCAEAVQRNDLPAADEMVREIIHRLASPYVGAMGKVAAYFVEALASRIYGINCQESVVAQAEPFFEQLYFQFYETCPYLKFAHFTANQAILEAVDGHKQVHVIDFNLMQGLQWPALIQALALRPGGPPHLRLTGIGPPQPDGKDVLQEIGMKLAQLAESVNVEFDFRGVVATKLDDVKPWMLQARPGEAIAVNSILQLHRLLYFEPTGPPIDEVLRSVRSLNPTIITLVEHEASHNSPLFLDRFMQALHFYSTMFDSLEACNLPPQSSQQHLAERYLGSEIYNIVACEGTSRVERHETLSQWRVRMSTAGFRPVHLGSNAFKQASMLLTLFSGEGYTVEENNGCLTLGWHSRPLIAASAWACR